MFKEFHLLRVLRNERITFSAWLFVRHGPCQGAIPSKTIHGKTELWVNRMCVAEPTSVTIQGITAQRVVPMSFTLYPVTIKLHPRHPIHTAPICKFHPAYTNGSPSSLGFPIPEPLVFFLPHWLPLPLSGTLILIYTASGCQGSAVLTALALPPRHTNPCHVIQSYL